MISVEQIRALEERIEKAIAYIGSLRDENADLSSKLAESAEALGRAEARAVQAEAGLSLAVARASQAEVRARDLEEAAADFRRDQLRIEEGIVHALEKLDAFEDLVLRGDAPRGDAPKGEARHGATPKAVPQKAEPVTAKPAPVEPKADMLPEPQEAFAAFSSGDDDLETETAADTTEAEATMEADAPVVTTEKAVDELDIF